MKIYLTACYTYLDIKNGLFTWKYRDDFKVIDHACKEGIKKKKGYFIDSEEACPSCKEFCPPMLLLAANLNVEVTI